MTLFVSAVGHPEKRTVDRLHEGGVLVMNMVGHPKHARKAMAVGVDLICAQGTEGSGSFAEIRFVKTKLIVSYRKILIPQFVSYVLIGSFLDIFSLK